jgi:hypothetical protein
MSFGFQSIEHAFASVAKAIGKGFQDVVKEVPVIQKVAAEVQPVVQVVLADLCPPAVAVENAGYAALAKFLAAIDKTAADGQQLTPANVLSNVTLVDSEIQDIKAVGTTVKQGLVDIGVIKSTAQTLVSPTLATAPATPAPAA